MLLIDPRGKKPIYEQIKDNLREQIIRRVWKPHEKLPSVRELALSTGINPNTIQKAVRDLEGEGFIYSVPGRGSYASEMPEGLLVRRKAELTGKLKPVLAELRIAGMPVEETIEMVKEVYSMEGKR